MEWLSENWLWVLLGIIFVVMHLFGHGGHGSHGGHGVDTGDEGQRKSHDEKYPPKRSGTSDGHGHH